MDASDVILAVASPPGFSARGIVRISGEQTFELLTPLLSIPSSPIGSADRAGDVIRFAPGLHRARLHLDAGALPCLALIFRAPRSYTGEDAAELQLPGNPALLERVVDALLDSARERDVPTRRAEPGEFTARAFFRGKLSMTEAEGVAATIAAQSDAELRAAHVLSSGKLGTFARELADELAGALALVEAGIDFTDQEDVVPIGPGELNDRLSSLHRAIAEQLDRAVGTERLEAIPWVVLAGPPNAGKSTLFNALLGRERAVVSDVAGTTRDVLAEPLTISTDHGPGEVMLVDHAGADDERTTLNQQMQLVAREARERAELVLFCVPVDQVVHDQLPRSTLVRTKADQLVDRRIGTEPSLYVSARTGEGLDELRGSITAHFADRAVSLAADAMVLRPRHEAALREAVRELGEAIELLEPTRDDHDLSQPELIAATMRAALDQLSALAGDITPDDVLGRVFANFCVGK
jgi:tRNA modification GTPase